MWKKLVLVLFLALQFVAVAKVGVKSVPWPECFPCDVR
jgi:hypothetical protein